MLHAQIIACAQSWPLRSLTGSTDATAGQTPGHTELPPQSGTESKMKAPEPKQVCQQIRHVNLPLTYKQPANLQEDHEQTTIKADIKHTWQHCNGSRRLESSPTAFFHKSQAHNCQVPKVSTHQQFHNTHALESVLTPTDQAQRPPRTTHSALPGWVSPHEFI